MIRAKQALFRTNWLSQYEYVAQYNIGFLKDAMSEVESRGF